MSSFIYAAPTEPPISLEFRDTELSYVLKAFSKAMNTNILMGPGVAATKINAHIVSMPPRQALDLVLKSNGLTAITNGNAIIVRHADAVMLERKAIVLQHITASEIVAAVGKFLDSTAKESIAAYPEENSVLIQADLSKMTDLHLLIRTLDQPAKQVLVSAKILELKQGIGDADTPSSYGLSFTGGDSPSGNYAKLSNPSIGPNGTGFYAQLFYDNVSAYLSALEKTVGFNVIASPWVTAINHRESELLIGSKFGYKTVTVTTTGTLEEVKFLEVGIKLRFTPHISEDGFIRMHIAPAISDGSVNNNLPQENTTETRNEVLVKDGQTIMIGGLKKNYDQEVFVGLPLLSSLPFIGNWFGRTEIRQESRDIMILITPHIVTPEVLADMQARSSALETKIQEKSKAKE